MPELPEVEVLVRQLAPLLKNKMIRSVEVSRPKFLAPTSEREFSRVLRGAKFTEVTRRGKYLVFTMRLAKKPEPVLLVGHLGMTGRMYLAGKDVPLPKHAPVTMDLGKHRFIFEDTRYFGRLTLDSGALKKLGPEPLESEFTAEYLEKALKRSGQAIKVKLLDQALVAGVGNIYASEALFRAGISPRAGANRLDGAQVKRLWRSIRQVLTIAIRQGSMLPIDIAADGARDGLFYFGSKGDANGFYAERLLVYDRRGLPCVKCGTAIERLTQAARSTYFCPKCQPVQRGRAKIS
jgi:formamidopyrimidine-DNA glycosylase